MVNGDWMVIEGLILRRDKLVTLGLVLLLGFGMPSPRKFLYSERGPIMKSPTRWSPTFQPLNGKKQNIKILYSVKGEGFL
jgi:hypothetical protein